MKIGIIVHSKTGNTNFVAQQLKDELTSRGHKVNLKMVTALNDDQMLAAKVELKDIPSIAGYDMIILGAPVRGFSLSPVMMAYVSQIKTLKKINIFTFVTEFLPFKKMGGSNAIKQFKEIVELKDGKVLGTGIINWSNFKRNKQIDDLVQSFSKLI